MIKHSLLIVVLMSLFALPSLSGEYSGFRGGYWAFSNKELSGFRGHLWGSSMPLMWRMDPRDNDGTFEICTKNLVFKTKIGAATLSYIEYYFYKNKLFGVGLFAEGNDNSVNLLEALETKFGPINYDSLETSYYEWEGHEYKILYQTSFDGACAKIWSPRIEKLIESDRILNERKKDLKTREETKNAVNDF